MRKIFLGLFILLFGSVALASNPAVYSLMKEGRVVAYIAASWHLDTMIAAPDNYIKTVKSAADGSDFLLIESDIRHTPTPHEVAKLLLQNSPSLYDLMMSENLTCLKQLTLKDWSTKYGFMTHSGIDSGPLAILMWYGIPAFSLPSPITKRSLKNVHFELGTHLALDKIVLNHFLQSNKRVQEFEGNRALEVMKSTKPVTLAKMAEQLCLKMTASTFSHDQVNIPINQLFEWLEYGEIDELRSVVIKKHMLLGWSTDILNTYLPQRELLSAKYISTVITTQKDVPLILAGAVHLGGEDGLLAELQKLGYKVIPYSH